jgi:hypothetical protein
VRLGLPLGFSDGCKLGLRFGLVGFDEGLAVGFAVVGTFVVGFDVRAVSLLVVGLFVGTLEGLLVGGLGSP